MVKSFNLETWTDDFIELGFHSKLLIGFQSMLKKWEEKFGCNMVEVILRNETVGDIVEAFLEEEVNYYSCKQMEAATQRDTATAPDLKDQSTSSQLSSTMDKWTSKSSSDAPAP